MWRNTQPLYVTLQRNKMSSILFLEQVGRNLQFNHIMLLILNFNRENMFKMENWTFITKCYIKHLKIINKLVSNWLSLDKSKSKVKMRRFLDTEKKREREKKPLEFVFINKLSICLVFARVLYLC